MSEKKRNLKPETGNLKPCPFCGCEDIVMPNNPADYCICDGCHATGPASLTMEGLKKAWNTRFQPQINADEHGSEPSNGKTKALLEELNNNIHCGKLVVEHGTAKLREDLNADGPEAEA